MAVAAHHGARVSAPKQEGKFYTRCTYHENVGLLLGAFGVSVLMEPRASGAVGPGGRCAHLHGGQSSGLTWTVRGQPPAPRGPRPPRPTFLRGLTTPPLGHTRCWSLPSAVLSRSVPGTGCLMADPCHPWKSWTDPEELSPEDDSATPGPGATPLPRGLSPRRAERSEGVYFAV